MIDLEFVEDFKQSSYYNLFFKKGVILAFLAGSRVIGAIDSLSDYDVVIVTDNKCKVIDKGLYLKYQGVRVHFYYVTLDNLVSNCYSDHGDLISLMQFREVIRDELLFENEAYKDVVDRLFERRYSLSEIAMFKYTKRYSRLLDRVFSNRSLEASDYRKYLYHLCYIAFRLSREELDIDVLNAAKRSCIEGLSEEFERKVVMALVTLKRLSDFYSIDDLVNKAEPDRIYVLEVQSK